MLAISMNTMVIMEITGELKDAIERLREEKPPEADTLNEWQMASNQFIPAAR